MNSVADFFLVLQDVRNSLFHGDPRVHGERDGALIDAAQHALDLAWQAALQNTGNPKLARFCESFRFTQ